MTGTQRVLEGLVLQDVGDRLSARPPGPRNPAGDDAIFEALRQATVSAVSHGQYQFAIRLFEECFDLTRQYEEKTNSEVHKGAMTFNVAIVYLRANDFAAAMHYLELAQKETRATTGDDGWGIYDFPLFQQNFWKLLDRYERSNPLRLFVDFWGTPFSADEALKDWARLSSHSKLLYVIVNAERISYSRLTPLPHWPISESFSSMYWNLIANLSRLIETELGDRGMKASGLRNKVLNNVGDTAIAGFGAQVKELHKDLPVNKPADFNRHFRAYHQKIMDPGRAREERIAAAALFAGVTRNQVQHQVDTGMIIFTDRAAATFTAEVLLSLCRFDGWAHP